MLYDVYFNLGYDGWSYETFDDFSEALKFAEDQSESRIVGYHQTIPISYNINILYK